MQALVGARRRDRSRSARARGPRTTPRSPRRARASAAGSCIWRERSTISGWWFTPKTRGIDAAARRARTPSWSAASPGGPPDARASRSRCAAAARAARARAGDEVEEPVVHHAQAAAVGQLVRELREPGMRAAPPASARSRGCPRSCRPSSGPRSTGCAHARPAAHHAEGVADGQQRRVARAPDGVEQREERRLPGRVLARCPGCPSRRRRCRCGSRWPGPARAQVEREAAAGGPPGSCGRGAPRRRARARAGPCLQRAAAGRRPRPAPRAPASRGPGWASRGSCPGWPRPRVRRRAAGRSAGRVDPHVLEDAVRPPRRAVRHAESCRAR